MKPGQLAFAFDTAPSHADKPRQMLELCLRLTTAAKIARALGVSYPIARRYKDDALRQLRAMQRGGDAT